MKIKAVSGTLLTLLLVGMLTLAFNVQPAKAEPGIICIKADGSVEPDTAPISSVDNVTYTFTDNIFYGRIVVMRDNIVVDGAGYTVRGTGSVTGIDLSRRNNITLKNVEVTNFDDGICLYSSSNNTLAGNTVRNNEYGIILGSSSNNTLFHNNLIDNTFQAHVTTGYVNTWDNGYSSGGNYWDDYGELDTDGDGIGDTPYVIDANNQDRYPLVVPLRPISIVWDEMTYPIELKSNSTISRFQFNWGISFNVTGPDGTLGFCNLTTPNSLVQDLWQGNLTVLVDGEEPIMMNNWTDGTHTYIYFTYLHPEHKVEIIPEFPTWTSILIILIMLTVAIAIYKRRLLKTPTH